MEYNTSHSKSNQIKTVYMNTSQLAGGTNRIYPHSRRKKRQLNNQNKNKQTINTKPVTLAD